MKKVITIFLSLLAFFFYSNTASAQVVINEVQISPIAERFIELHNTGDSDIDLTDWYIQRKTATGSSFGSSVTKTKFENKIIKPRGYFLISRTSLSSTDIIVDNMTLTDSNTLRLRNSNGEDIDQIEWESLNEGESYQKIGNGWTSATPTPATSNLDVQRPSGQGPALTTSTQTQEPSPSLVAISASSWPAEPQIFARVKSAPRVAVVGADILLKGEVLGLKKVPLKGARYLWTLGDGGTKEGESVLYNYNYPGKYVVILNTSSGEYSASDRVTIEAIPADIEISSVGTGADSFVEIHNKTKYELNLSWWRLRLSARLPALRAQAGNVQAGTGEKIFTIPKDTIILSGAKIMFPSQHTEFKIIKGENVDLLYPNSIVATSFTWTSNVQVKEPQVKTQVSPKAKTKAKTKAKSATSAVPALPPQAVTPAKDHSSQAQEEKQEEVVSPATIGEHQTSNIFTATNGNSNDIYKWLLGVTALAIISVFGVIFTGRMERKALNISREADEYEIIEDKE